MKESSGKASLPLVPSSASPPDCADVLKALADGTRLSVLRLLMEKPRHVGELQQELGLEQSLLSHHLRVLRDHELVEARRDGKAVLYRLAPGTKVAAGPSGIDLGCCLLTFQPESRD